MESDKKCYFLLAVAWSKSSSIEENNEKHRGQNNANDEMRKYKFRTFQYLLDRRHLGVVSKISSLQFGGIFVMIHMWKVVYLFESQHFRWCKLISLNFLIF